MSSQDPLSYLDPSLSFPHNTSLSRVASHTSSAPSAELASSPSLYVTFKVLQLVNQFRKRVRTRVQSTRRSSKGSSTRLTEDFCQAFEREAAEHIDYVLGKTRARPSRKTPYPDRVRSSLHKRKVTKRSVKTAAAAKPETESTAAKKIEWLLKALDKSVKSETHSLSALAKNHELFVERKGDFHVQHESWKELLPQLVRVTNLLDTLRRVPSSRSSVKTFAESDEGVNLSFDENIIANFEHLLLCLKEQLIRLLIAELRELVKTHVIECQRDEKQHTKELVLEFPDGRHPLSTTWPWSIKPSLAVIWGVCWMFYVYYDSEGNMRDHPSGTLLLPADQVQDLMRNQGPNQGNQTYYPANQTQQYQEEQGENQQSEYFQAAENFGQAISPQRSPGDQRAVPRTMMSAHSPVIALPMTQPHNAHAFFGGQSLATAHPPNYPTAPDQAAAQNVHAAAGHAGYSNNAFPAAPRVTYAAAPPGLYNSLPQDPAQFINLHSSDSTYGGGSGGFSWPPTTVQGQQPSNYYAHSATLPPESRSPPAQTAHSLRVNTSNFQGFEPPQPQEYLSATPVSATSATSGHNYGQFLSPQDVRARPLPMTSPEQPDQQYTTPKSESPVPHALLAHQHSRKRSYGEMTEGGQPHVHSRNGSRAGSETYQHHQQSGDDGSPDRQRSNTAINRPDPPTNAKGKYICTVSNDCASQTFDRKCEWNKHMDKHDRPYRCPHPDCGKLQGFTYSGGLLRHEREVHNKHGGPKSSLMCPYPDCKRKDKGFTRKENLNEHVRRVHSKESQSQPSPMKREGTDGNALAGALPEDAETPASRTYSESGLEHDGSLASPAQQPKRRRLDSNVAEASEIEQLRLENEQLRQENLQLRRDFQQFMQQQTSQQGPPGQG